MSIVFPMMASSEESTMAAKRSNASSVCLRSEMSRPTTDTPTTSPSLVLMGDTATETSITVPSLRRRLVS